MVKATVQEVVDAFGAFTSIGAEKLSAKAAYRVSRLISKLKSEVRDFEETKRKLFLDAGGVNEAGDITIKGPDRCDGESQADFDARVKQHAEVVNKLSDDINALLKEPVEIDYDPIPMTLFENESDPAKSAQLRPVDLANAGPFIKE